MSLEAEHAVRSADQSLRAIGTDGQIRQLRRTVTPDAITGDRFPANVEFLVEQRHHKADTAAAAGAGVVQGANRTGREQSGKRARNADRSGGRLGVVGLRADNAAGEDTIAEGAQDAEHFVVSPARIESGLDDEVRRFVDRVSRGIDEVFQAATRARCVNESIANRGDDAGVVGTYRGEPSSADGGLWAFDRCGKREFSAEVLHDAERVLTRPGEADDVLRVDHHGKSFAKVLDAFAIFRRQSPHLAAGKAPAVVEEGLAPDLALAEDITIALAIVGGHSGTEEVALEVAR